MLPARTPPIKMGHCEPDHDELLITLLTVGNINDG
jgi:hypothetical protein